jgi:hypothetical protein
MARDDLTNRETAILLALLAQGRKISNKELDERFHFKLVGPEREKLNGLKLVESGKEKGHGNTIFHELTDRGWARGREELEPRQRARTSIPAGILFAFAEGVDRFVSRERIAVADVFRADPPASAAPTAHAAPAAPAKERPPATPVAEESPYDIETAVRTAYTKLAGEPGDWVRLATIRPLLGDAPKSDVDRTLLRMARQRDVRIVPDEDQKSLTDADRSAALRIGDHDNHLLLIGLA